MLTKFSLTQSTESASRRCNDINLKISGDTLLRLSKKWEPTIDKKSIYPIGIDDFALKKHHYGTVIINLDTGKIIDILNTRDPEKIQKVLDEYPNLHTISRDRGYSYRTVSKECFHVVDRFHLIMNLSEVITKEIKQKLHMLIKIMKLNNKIEIKEPKSEIKEFTI